MQRTQIADFWLGEAKKWAKLRSAMMRDASKHIAEFPHCAGWWLRRVAVYTRYVEQNKAAFLDEMRWNSRF